MKAFSNADASGGSRVVLNFVLVKGESIVLKHPLVPVLTLLLQVNDLLELCALEAVL